MVAKAGAGPKPIPYRSLSADNLARAVQMCLTPEARDAAHRVSLKMKRESGAKEAVNSFHRNLKLTKIRCDIMPDQAAIWIYKHGNKDIKLSKAALDIIMRYGKIDRNWLRWYVFSGIG